MVTRRNQWELEVFMTSCCLEMTAPHVLLGELWRCLDAHISNQLIGKALRSKLTAKIFVTVDGAQKTRKPVCSLDCKQQTTENVLRRKVNKFLLNSFVLTWKNGDTTARNLPLLSTFPVKFRYCRYIKNPIGKLRTFKRNVGRFHFWYYPL